MVRLAGRQVSSTEELVDLYRARYASRGACSTAMFYKDLSQHEAKLRAFAELCSAFPGADSVLDVGCGYGALLDYWSPSGQYLGVDVVREFVEEARARHPDRRFLCADIQAERIPTADWVLLTGVLSSVPHPEDLATQAIRRARKGVLFDVTIAERLPGTFVDLNRWTVLSALEIAKVPGWVSTIASDRGRSWVIVRTVREPRSGLTPSTGEEARKEGP